MQTAPTCDSEFRVSFFRIILKKMMRCKNHIRPSDLDFNSQEIKVIEYYVKDVSREPVPEDTSHEEILEVFVQQLIRLFEGDTEEWAELEKMHCEFRNSLTDEEISDFHSLIIYFLD